MLRRPIRMFLPLLLAASSAPVTSQQVAGAPPARATLEASTRQSVVAKFAEALRRRYVSPDVGERTAAKIEAALAAGDYDRLTDPAAFTTRLTLDASAVAHDKHLNMWTTWAPPPAPPPGTAMTTMPSAEAGIVRADRLSGGIGYIELIGFPPAAVLKPALDKAMTSLAGSRTLIIDVRRNGGGSPEGVAYLSSFLVPPDRLLNDIVARVENTGDFTRTGYRSQPTPVTFANVPVYVLTSAATFSGGEGFAYEVQAQKRATVIGEVTGGGANPTGMVQLMPGFIASIPFARAENPVTKTNWEGRGVQPDISVPAERALATALERAGERPVAEIGAASIARVFTPRSTARPGTEAALRGLLSGLSSGKPDYDTMTPAFADATRQQLPQMQAQFAALGPLQSVKFRGPAMPDGDQYELHFDGGDQLMTVILDPVGKLGALMLSPVPLPAAR